ncbi:CinA family nicotinamide mononucleotide deamidase-related protein [Chlorobium sp. BLA1]|uniref:CinA family nicotinamide mononucleotide deamidase-related protein n=1 Tax=Candidatus Chlorobium masyuteum TaxID=2716876 RepID=UPI00141FC522|nr:CinA family nicotinamide mononucleotide deamidase-related protein [Candidatus Chlorobium masyuteum]NHQ59792.1 CinA family nicotinamide mononucleotide deamidase-related protein [Candidatus Chlorobium masyuteum]NTU44927.1 CinA family nicotinamide mononucleotide deamidase-related protein [Chlorobiaceae bacterium]
MRADIVSIGDELLKGQRVNTNASFMAGALAGIGIAVNRIVACADVEPEIAAVLAESLERSEVVLVTGGLGPTRDDRTRSAVQQLLQRGVELSEDAYQNLAALMKQRGRTMSDALRDQAMVIEGSHVILNTKGSAAGMIIGCGDPFRNHYLVLMPGVPSEMKAMMELTVLPYFSALSSSFIRHTPVKTLGIGESMLAEMIVEVEDSLPKGTTLAYLPHAAGVSLMISTVGSDRERVEEDNKGVVDAIIKRAKRFIYATGESTLEETIGELLSRRGLTVAVAESCTGGLVASRLTDVAGSSAYFLQGFVVYTNKAKEETLGVPKERVEEFGAVSEEVACAMARGCLEKSGADFALATTGIAGPAGGSAEKPVGMLCLALAVKSSGAVQSRTLFMHGDRELNKIRFSEAVLRELWEYLRAS